MDLTQYDIKPAGMINYLRYNGPHFSKALALFAIGKMTKKGKPIKEISKDEVNNILAAAGIGLDNDYLYDSVYVYHMAIADFSESSITTREQLARYVKDYLDDEDGYDGIAFNRFMADCARKGIPIDWEAMI